jgi:hypothetical protein
MVKLISYNLISFLVLLVVFTSCTKDESFKIGEKYLDVSTNISCIDTFTIHSYTIKLDSIKTSGLAQPAMLVGKYTDPEFGDVTSRSYYRFTLPTESLSSLPKDAVYDSIKLCLLYNKYYAGDTTKYFTIKVHRLLEKMVTQDGYFYNNESIGYSPDPLGSRTFKPKPHNRNHDSVWIKLDDAFGSELFDRIMSNDVKVENNTNFLINYRGLMLDYGDPCNAILGFHFPGNSETNDPAIRLYYHFTNIAKHNKYLSFLSQSADYGKEFNHIELTGAPVVNFPTKQSLKLPSTKTNDQTYVMAGLGIITRIEIPYLKNLFLLHKNIRLLSATLEFEPVKDTYKKFELPDSLSLYTSNWDNHFIDAIKNSSNNQQYGSLYIDRLYQENTHYTFDVTSYLQSCLDGESDDIATLLLTVPPDNLFKTVERVVLGSGANSTNNMKLTVYYMFYE